MWLVLWKKIRQGKGNRSAAEGRTREQVLVTEGGLGGTPDKDTWAGSGGASCMDTCSRKRKQWVQRLWSVSWFGVWEDKQGVLWAGAGAWGRGTGGGVRGRAGARIHRAKGALCLVSLSPLHRPQWPRTGSTADWLQRPMANRSTRFSSWSSKLPSLNTCSRQQLPPEMWAALTTWRSWAWGRLPAFPGWERVTRRSGSELKYD